MVNMKLERISLYLGFACAAATVALVMALAILVS